MDVSKLKAGQVFHSRSNDFIGNLIAWAVSWGRPKKDTPNHSGFIVQWEDEFLVAEVDGKGFRLNSLEKYNGKKAKIVSLFDLKIDVYKRSMLLEIIARKVRKDYDKPYDYEGAIGSAPWFQRWFPWLSQCDKKEFCSEVVAMILCAIGLPVSSLSPNPLELEEYQASRPQYYTRIL